MSLSHDRRRKARRRLKDLENPYRKEVRRKIRDRELPRFYVERAPWGLKKKHVTDPKTGQCIFKIDKEDKILWQWRLRNRCTKFKLKSSFNMLTTKSAEKKSGNSAGA